MPNLSLEEIKKQYESPVRDRLFYRDIPNSSFFWQKKRWIDVTNQFADYSDAEVDLLVRETPNLFYMNEIPLEDYSFDRYLKKEIRQTKLRDRLRAIYGKKRNAGPSFWFDVSVVSLVLVMGTLHVFSNSIGA